jgi:hypothetical protein
VLQAWRKGARAAGLPVDVWVSLLLERQLVEAELGDLYAGVLDAAVASAAQPRLVTGPWMDWLDQLTAGIALDDELPSVVLPARVLARIVPTARAKHFAVLHSADLSAARTLETAAAREGLTMEAWAYRCAMRLARS